MMIRRWNKKQEEKRNESAAVSKEMPKNDEKKKYQNHITELVFILDRSGSMRGLESDTIGGFNATIDKQKKIEGEVLVTTYLFDHENERLHDRVSIEEIRPMTERDYWVRGNTALLDAVGEAIEHIQRVHRYLRKEDVPEHTMFVITTDGMENASRRYTKTKIKSMIEERTENAGWEFLFLGANIDAVEAAGEIGIRRERASGYRASPEGVGACYCAVSSAISSVRAGNSADDTSWRKELETEEKKPQTDDHDFDDIMAILHRHRK